MVKTDIMLEYVPAIVALFLLNVQPFFNMPTWVVLSFFSFTSGLPILPLTLIGVAIASIGRYVLAKYTGRFTDQYLPKKQKENIKFISKFIGNSTKPVELFTVSFLYGLSPLPTNTLFMVAGAAHLRLPVILAGFFFGEFFSNFIYVQAVQMTFDLSHFMIFGAVGIALAAAVMFIDWKSVILWLVKREKKMARKKGKK